ncbi:MAG: hypothetical protein HUU16_08945, partial [Candidatus Omnitrophica bacterium]|nr:hypothetical protein [Candidatus Omnitrophota bacterium]
MVPRSAWQLSSLFLIGFALAFDSSEAATRLEQAEQLFHTGNGHAAEKIYRSLIREITSASTVPEASSEVHVRALSGLLGVALRYGDHPLAEKTIEAATTTFPSNPGLLTRAGEYMLYRGRLEDARSLWSRALELDSEAMEARYRLAELERSQAPQRDPKAPYQWFEKRFRSKQPIAPNDLEWIGRACLRLEKYEWDGAQKAYQDALDA